MRILEIRTIVTLVILIPLVACQPLRSFPDPQTMSRRDEPYIFIFSDEDRCPTDAFTLSRTCKAGNPDKPNETCLQFGDRAIVRWFPLGKPIKIVWPVNGNPTSNCSWHERQRYYQCVIPANTSKGEYDYEIRVRESDSECGTDPMIIIK
jgi:hypothetical protein